MGITIGNKNMSIDMGYGGFANLRDTIAKIYSEEFGALYKNWTMGKMTNEEGNKQLAEFYHKGVLTDDDDLVLDFLFAPDCDGKLSVKGCRKLYKHIKDYDDNVLYGYWGRPDCAKFKDFKEIVKTCAKNRWIMRWY